MSKSGISLIKYCFFKKRIKFELIRNNTHQMKSWREREREYFIPQERATEDFHYPRYVTRLQKERQIQAKTKNLHEKLCTKTMSPNQLKIDMITKNNKILRLHFFQVTTFVSQKTSFIVILWKKNKNLQKRGELAKITKIGFLKTGCSKKKDHLRKIKPLWRANCISKD